MRVKWYLLCIFVLLVSNINIVNAEECDTNYILEMKELANNISYEQEYIGNDIDPQLYKVTFDNIDSSLYIEYLNGLDDVRLINSSNSSIDVLSGNNEFKVYSLKCASMVGSIEIDLPKYNEYSNSDVCQNDAKDLDICDKWYQGEITEDKFNELVSSYEDDGESTILQDSIKEFVMNNIYYFIGGIFLLVILISVLLYIKKKNSYLK